MENQNQKLEEDLIREIAGHNESAPARHRAQAQLNLLVAKRANAPTLMWTKIAAVAAIVAALFAAWGLLKS